MEVLPRAVATSSVSVTASAAGKESPGSGKKSVQVSVPAVPFLRPASALAASLLASAPPAALALNYDDFLKKAADSASSAASGSSFPELPSIELPSIDLPSVDLDGASDFVSANPLALVGVLVAVAVPFIASRAFAGPTSFGSVSGIEAYKKLSDPEQNTQLLDIRALEDIKAEGSPNLRALRKTPLKVAYAANDDAFVEKVLAKCKIAEDTTLYVLDRFDGSAATVAKLLANSGFKSAYAIKGGAEGQNGWREKDLPWLEPAKSFNLNIDGLKSILKDGEGVNADGLAPTALGVAAATGVGLIVFSEAETALQLLGTVAVLQLFVKKFLYAADRKKTIQDIKTFLDTKIAPKEFVEEIKEVGRAILPKDGEVQAAVETGAAVLEKELNVDSVTPETLAEKAKEKVIDEAEKLGVEVPDLEGVKSDIQSTVELVTSDLKSGAKELQSNVDAAISDLESGAEDLKSNAGEVTSDLKSKAEEVTSNVESEAEEVGSDLKSGAEEAKSAVESSTESITSSNGSAAPAPGAVEEAEKEVTPFFESDIKPVSQEEEQEAALAALEGDEPSAFTEEGVGEDVTAKKLEGVIASSPGDTSS